MRDDGGDDTELQQGMTLAIAADPLAVRAALRHMMAVEPLARLSDQDRGTAEIVLAEVMNNIVEHGYEGAGGEVHIRLCAGPGHVACVIEDRGAPMPNGQLPPGDPVSLRPGDPLPEGGFGWYLIRVLTQNLEYQRRSGVNRLSFHLETDQSPL
jgi:serine/threonine-protein kinase RsbW